MRFKALALLGLILILLILYLLLLEIPSEKRRNEDGPRSKMVLAFKEEEVKGYEIRSDLYNIRVERDSNGALIIAGPIKTDPDPAKIRRFISLLENIEIKRIVDEKPTNLKIYGFDKPQMEISIRLEGREERLILGDNGPIMNTLYIKKAGDEKVFLVDNKLREDIPDKFSAWRRATIMPFDSASVDKVGLDYRNRSFLIVKDNDKWILKKPIETAADQAEVNDLLSSLASLSARDFIDEGKEDLIKKISTPRLKVDIRVSGKERTASFYIPYALEKDIIYAVTTPQEPIYKVDEFHLKSLDKDLYNLREKRVLDLKEGTVNKIEIKRKDEVLKIVKEEKDWVIGDRSDQKADLSKVLSLLHSLRDLKAEGFVDNNQIDLSRFGLDAPNKIINLYDKDNKIIGSILFGKEKEKIVYAKSNISKSVFMVKRGVLGSIPSKDDLMNKDGDLSHSN